MSGNEELPPDKNRIDNMSEVVNFLTGIWDKVKVAAASYAEDSKWENMTRDNMLPEVSALYENILELEDKGQNPGEIAEALGLKIPYVMKIKMLCRR